MKVLGLDIGERRIGVAKAGDLGVAVPFDVVEVDDLASAIGRIRVIVDKEKPDLIVYGDPLNAEGERAEQANRVGEFIVRLSTALPGMKFEPVDESFTTRTARETLRSMKVVKPRDRKKVIDKIAAVLLLQRYLDRKR